MTPYQHHLPMGACGNERLLGAVAGSQTNTAAIFQQTFRSLPQNGKFEVYLCGPDDWVGRWLFQSCVRKLFLPTFYISKMVQYIRNSMDMLENINFQPQQVMSNVYHRLIPLGWKKGGKRVQTLESLIIILSKRICRGWGSEPRSINSAKPNAMALKPAAISFSS